MPRYVSTQFMLVVCIDFGSGMMKALKNKEVADD